MRMLVLGGTAWVGGEIAAAALRRGHEVVCLARGESGAVPEGARLVRADRDRANAYAAVAEQRWDAVLDVARQPGHVRGAVAALEPVAARFLFVSTGNVYADHATPHAAEDAQLLTALEADQMASMEQYGEAKVACEQAVLGGFGPDRSLVARSGLISGPGDSSGRTGYWPWRMAHPASHDGAVLIPDAAGLETEVIDVRDLASWLVTSAEGEHNGVFNAGGPTMRFSDHLAQAQQLGGPGAQLVPAPEQWLLDQGVHEWAGPRSLPMWLADPSWRSFNARDSRLAHANGLICRPLEDTLRDVLAWEQTQPAPARRRPERRGRARPPRRPPLRRPARRPLSRCRCGDCRRRSRTFARSSTPLCSCR